jgi:hypothetical protein
MWGCINIWFVVEVEFLLCMRPMKASRPVLLFGSMSLSAVSKEQKNWSEFLGTDPEFWVRFSALPENREYDLRGPSHWPRDTLYLQKLVTSPTSWVCIVRSSTETSEFVCFVLLELWLRRFSAWKSMFSSGYSDGGDYFIELFKFYWDTLSSSASLFSIKLDLS